LQWLSRAKIMACPRRARSRLCRRRCPRCRCCSAKRTTGPGSAVPTSWDQARQSFPPGAAPLAVAADAAFLEELPSSSAGAFPGAPAGVQGRPSAVARVGEEPRASPAPTARPRAAAVRLRGFVTLPPPPRRPHLRGATGARRRRRKGSRGAPPRSRAWGRSRGRARRTPQEPGAHRNRKPRPLGRGCAHFLLNQLSLHFRTVLKI